MAAARLTCILSVMAALGLSVLGVAAPAWGEDAEQVRKAAAAFDDGSTAYREGKFEVAASRFEAADAAVPSTRALRMAIRARAEAKQPDRAATLAELALTRHADDEATASLARKTIAASKKELHLLDIRCNAPCVVAVGSRSVHGAAAKRWRVWVPPGETSVSASFVGGAGSDEQVISAHAGGQNALSFLAKEGGPVAPDPLPQPQPAEEPRAKPEPALPVGEEAQPDDGPSAIQHPGVFIAGLIATAGLGGVLVWSGVDTLGSPGKDAVREGCVGQGEDCELYQEGLDKQLRTNILIGATAGMGAITAIFGIFVTDWDGSSEDGASFYVSPEGGFATLRQRF
jgi:hypothetical protein